MGSSKITLDHIACIMQKPNQEVPNFFQRYASSVLLYRAGCQTGPCGAGGSRVDSLEARVFRLTGLVSPLRTREGMNPVYSVYVGVFNQILWTFRCSARLVRDCWDNRCFICWRRTHHGSSFCLMGGLFDWRQETKRSTRKSVSTCQGESF